MDIKPHSPAWYDSLATIQTGYYYPWQSLLSARHGEDIFLQMVKEYVSTTSDVLEVACAHGELAISIAPLCHSIVGYDRVASWINRAQTMAEQQGRQNMTFYCHDSSSEINDGFARIPAGDDLFDLLICSKGPFHWVEDARRVARQGAILLMLVPEPTPLTKWSGLLPEALRWQAVEDPNWARTAIEQRLAVGGLALDSWWSFDTPEIFSSPEHLYLWLCWGKRADEVPSFAEMRPVLEYIFDQHGVRQDVEIRRRRHIWKAGVEK